MIYRLNDEFTKIEETEGLLQNRSDDVEIEFVVCKENPQKDSGAILAPSEKYTFAVKEGESIYARSNKMTGALANLAVLNFKKPASGGTGAGGYQREILFEGYAAASTNTTPTKLSLAGAADEYDYLIVCAHYGQPFNFILTREYPYNVVSAALDYQNCFCYIGRSGNVIDQSYCKVNGWTATGNNRGIYRVIGVKGA